MMHRKTGKPRAREDSFFRWLFLLLLFLSVLRLIDLLPPKDAAVQPAFENAAPAPSHGAERSWEQTGQLFVPRKVSGVDIETAILSRGLDLRGDEPRILIYHTHTTEAYTPTKSSPYVQTSSFRTADAEKSVLAVGEALAKRLRTEYGFSVLHDVTDHEPPSLKTAYERSEQTMLSYLERYPSLILFIDVHRDAGSDASDYVLVDGAPTARLMCVVGQGTQYEQKPDFDRNYALASGLTDHLRLIEGRLARDVRVKTGRYNQHVGELCLLIEVGHNANTLEQALHAVPSLAESLALTLAELDSTHRENEGSFGFCQLLVPGSMGIDKE